MREFPKLKSRYVDYCIKYMKGETTTHGSTPWVLSGDESGVLVPGKEQRFSVYATVGVPFFTYNTFSSSLPRSSGDKFLNVQTDTVLSLLKKCFGRTVVVYFDLNDTRMTKMVERHRKLRDSSSLVKPAKTAQIVWLDAMIFSIIEFVGSTTLKKIPVGNMHFHYDGRDMTEHMRFLMETYVPEQLELRLREIFGSLISEMGFNPFPKADPRIAEFGIGRTKEPLIMTADLVARKVFQELRDCGSVKDVHPSVIIKNLTDILAND